MARATVKFLCDGHIEKCKDHLGCYLNGGECKHTTNISHRLNGPYEWPELYKFQVCKDPDGDLILFEAE